MSTLTATIDIESKTIKVDKALETQPGSEIDNLTVAFTVSNNSISLVRHFTCGFFLTDNENQEIRKFIFPQAGAVSLVSPDGTISDHFEIEYNTSFVINFWAQNNGERFDTDVSFTTPIPTQPYASWKWNGSAWIPPTPRPIDKKGAAYAWSEKLKKWIELIPPLTQYDDIL